MARNKKHAPYRKFNVDTEPLRMQLALSSIERQELRLQVEELETTIRNLEAQLVLSAQKLSQTQGLLLPGVNK